MIMRANRMKERLEIQILKEDKEFIKNKASDLGFRTVSAFLLESAKNHFRLNIDMSIYREMTKEINYIGKNINSLIRRINTDGIYSDNDIDFLKTNQKIIIEIINKEYDRLLDLKSNITSENMTLKEKENLIKSFNQNQIEIPKKVLLEEIYEQIKNDFIFIVDAIDNSREQEKEVAEYIWEYLYGKTLFELDETKLIEFANKVFLFTQKLKIKLIKLDNVFDNEDWFNLKDILDEYEIY